jgi:uncharacterized repeat protein (TIGR01451 family)
MANILGTLISDLIVPNAILQGEILPDLLGDDIIEALDGDDAVAGSSGNDSIAGGSGDDQLFGNSGQDTIEGNSGNDSIAGGRDDDRIFGGEGNDLIFGNTGKDNLRGGDGNDTIYGGKDDDILQGEDGDDLLIGDFGTDTLNGGGGNDIFSIGRRPNNPDGASTGGLSAEVADVFQDFRQQGDDLIRLEGGIAFADLEFTDDANGDAVIRDANGTGEILATVKGKTAAELQANPAWFQPVGSGGGVPTAVADLQVTKTVSDQSPATPYNPGDTIQYVVTVNNTGPDTATNVQLTDLLPAGVTVVPGGITGNGSYNPATGVWNIGNVNSGGSAVLFIDATINAGATGTIVNTVTGLTATQADPDPTDNTASILFTIGGGVADAIAPNAPKLIDGESIVANTAGVLGRVGAVDNVGVTGFNITGITQNGVNSVVNAVTIDSTGQLTLTPDGATLLTTGNYLDVQLTAQDAAGNVSAAGTVRIFADINTAVNSATLSKIGDAADESFGDTAPDTVLVAAGLYVGAPISKTVTLRGANWENPIPATGVRPEPESEINGVLNVIGNAENVRIVGFEFSGAGQINLTGAGNSPTIENNLFDGTGTAILKTPGSPSIGNVTIQDNRIQNTVTGTPAISLEAVGGTIRENVLQNIGNQAAAIAGDDGIFVDGVTGLTISDNELNNISGSGIAFDIVAATSLPSTNVTIRNNRINGANNDTPIANTEGGIVVNPGVITDLSIVDNIVLNAGNGALTAAGTAGVPFTTRNNIFADLDGTATPPNTSIWNNIAAQTIFSVVDTLNGTTFLTEGTAATGAVGNVGGVGFATVQVDIS